MPLGPFAQGFCPTGSISLSPSLRVNYLSYQISPTTPLLGYRATTIFCLLRGPLRLQATNLTCRHTWLALLRAPVRPDSVALRSDDSAVLSAVHAICRTPAYLVPSGRCDQTTRGLGGMLDVLASRPEQAWTTFDGTGAGCTYALSHVRGISPQCCNADRAA
ncbi:hypothetical protein BV20DRAFT_40899 [Pilatotrama ljubarskyi]|nr:hypothetical protein BV20DRAFT_40899 [Pilatotrama ljubarskyi]